MEEFVAAISLESSRVSCVIAQVIKPSARNNNTERGKIKVLSGASKKSNVLLVNRGWPNDMTVISQLVSEVVSDAEDKANKLKEGGKPLFNKPIRASAFYLSVHGSEFEKFGGHIDKEFDGTQVMTYERLRDIFEEACQNIFAKGASDKNAILHVLPQRFYSKRNNAPYIMYSPLNMSVSSMSCDFIGVAASEDALNNLSAAVSVNNSYSIEKVFYSPVVLGEYILQPMEKNTGVVIIDMGSNTTTVSVYSRGAMSFFYELNAGGDTATMNIQYYLNQYQNSGNEYSLEKAEEWKIERGAIHPRFLPNNGRNITKLDKAEVQDSEVIDKCILVHIKEVLDTLKRHLDEFLIKQKQQEQISTVILTGNASNLRGMSELIRQYFKVNAVKPVVCAPLNATMNNFTIEFGEELKTMDYLVPLATLNYTYNAPAHNDLFSWNEDEGDSGILDGVAVAYERVRDFFSSIFAKRK